MSLDFDFDDFVVKEDKNEGGDVSAFDGDGRWRMELYEEELSSSLIAVREFDRSIGMDGGRCGSTL